MIDLSHLAWPFFDEAHREFAATLDQWACQNLVKLSDRCDVDQTCKSLVRALGDAGWLRTVVPASHGGSSRQIDLRKLCLAREILAWHHGLADFAFAMQGLGSGPISLFGSDALKARYLPAVCAGRRIAAFALTEPAAGSDVGALATTATAAAIDHVCINGIKTWISNGGIADHYIVFARTGEAPGVKGLSAFVVDANTPGLTTVERIEVIAPHPLATLRFQDCRIPVTQRLGVGGYGNARRIPRHGRRCGARNRQAGAGRGRKPCRHTHVVRPVAWRSADDPGRSRRKRRRSRCRSAASLSRCLEQRHRRRTYHARIVDSQDVRN